jgi:nicotinate dehydrogenase subunit B
MQHQASALWARGEYLVNGLGHCAACHSPRNAMGAEKLGESYLAGAMIDGWEAPPLTALSHAPVRWTSEELYRYLRFGHTEHHGVAGGPMADVVRQLATVDDADVRAMAVYLASFQGRAGGDREAAAGDAAAAGVNEAAGLGGDAARAAGSAASVAADAAGAVSASAMGAAANVAAAGSRSVPVDEQARLAESIVAQAAAEAASVHTSAQRMFETACGACHHDGQGPALLGRNAPLALNSNLHSERPDNLLRTILEGVREPATRDLGFMPPFRHALSDEQIAGVAAYMRGRFAPGKPAWQNLEAAAARIRQSPTNGHGKGEGR